MGVFSDLNSLESLDLSNNRVFNVEEAVFEGLHNLKRLDIRNGEALKDYIEMLKKHLPTTCTIVGE